MFGSARLDTFVTDREGTPTNGRLRSDYCVVLYGAVLKDEQRPRLPAEVSPSWLHDVGGGTWLLCVPESWAVLSSLTALTNEQDRSQGFVRRDDLSALRSVREGSVRIRDATDLASDDVVRIKQWLQLATGNGDLSSRVEPQLLVAEGQWSSHCGPAMEHFTLVRCLPVIIAAEPSHLKSQ